MASRRPGVPALGGLPSSLACVLGGWAEIMSGGGGRLGCVTESSDANRVLRTVVVCVLPYRDPFARRRVRRSARKLVAPGPWAKERANSNEVAQLALLRLLWLQREARRAAQSGMFEALALLTRSTIDTCIVGLYCLAVPEAAERINQLNAQNLKSMTEYLPTSFVDRRVRDEMVQLIDQPKRDPNIFAMVSAVDDAHGDETAMMLYRAYYAPLSTLYAHGGGVALLRHVDGDKIAHRPATYWSNRSALHVVDSCVGLLAARLATASGTVSETFQQYHDAHRDRTVTPLTVMALGSFRRAIKWRSVVGSVRAGRQLRDYLHSGRASFDDAETQERTIRDLTRQCLDALGKLSDPRITQLVVDEVVRQSLASIPSGG